MSTNQVTLSGRVSADPEVRRLPSGDEVVSFRLVVRPSKAAMRRSKQSVDTFECAAWSSAMRRVARRLSAGEHVEITGELRRRFTRHTGIPMSWVSVEVATCRRLRSPTVASGT